jgi:hypothetical protein
MLPANQVRFLAVEGFDLMLRIMREGGFARYGALKVLSHAVADCGVNCGALVDAGGLKEVFPAFMGRGAAHTRKLHGGEAAREEGEHAVAIVAACAQLLPLPGRPFPPPPVVVGGDVGARAAATGTAAAPSAAATATATATAGLQLLRLVGKFTEARHEKLDRLVELRRQCGARVHAATLRRLAEEAEEAAGEPPSDDDDEDEEEEGRGAGAAAGSAAPTTDASSARAQRRAARAARRTARDALRRELRYLARMDAGLFTLQRLDVTLGRLASVAVEAVAADEAAASAAAGRGPVHLHPGTAGSVAAGAALGSAAAAAPAPAGDVPPLASYLPLLQDVAFMTRSKLYEAAGAGGMPAASGGGAGASAAAAAAAAGLPLTLSLSLMGVSETLQEWAEKLEGEAAAGAAPGGAAGGEAAGTGGAGAGDALSLSRARAAATAPLLRGLVERVAIAAGWTGPRAGGSADSDGTGPGSGAGSGMDLL